jgi:hypothetical protein
MIARYNSVVRVWSATLRPRWVAVLRFRAYFATPSHVVLPVPDNLSLPHREGCCAAQQISARMVRLGSRAAVRATLALSPLCPPKRKSRLGSSLPCAISGCDRRELMLTRKRFQGRLYRRSRRERWPPESIQAFPIETWRPWKSSLSATWLWPRQQPP